MTDRLAISASFSVLMMAIYVLFGDGVARVPLAPGSAIEMQGEMPGNPLSGSVSAASSLIRVAN